MAVFVWRNAFGRTRKRRPQSSSSIASSPQSSFVGRFVTSAGRSFTDQWIERTSGKRAQRGDEALDVELAGRRHELDERLARVPALAHDEVAQVAGVLGLVVGLEPLGARPVARRVADRVPEVGRQPAALDVEHLVPAPGAVEAERRPLRRLCERVLELVPVVEDGLGGHDRLERRIVEPADPAQRVLDLVGLRRELRLVVEILEAAAAAIRVVLARRLDARRALLDDLDGQRLGVVSLHPRHSRAHGVARQAALDEERRSRSGARRRSRRRRATRS